MIAFIPMIADRDSAKDMNKRFMIVDFNSYVGKKQTGVEEGFTTGVCGRYI